MSHRFVAPPLAIGLLVLAALPVAARTPARADRDSLAQVERGIAEGRPSDPALLALAGRVAARLERELGPRHPDLAEALVMLGRLRLARGDLVAADSVLARAVAVRRVARRPDERATAVTLGWWAEAQRVTKQGERAVASATEALAALARAVPRDTAGEVRVLNTLGNTLAERGEVSRARDELERAVRLGEALADSTQLARSLRNLGRALFMIGDHAATEQAMTRAAAIQERVLGPDHPDLATTCYMASFAASRGGDFLAARRYAERALAIREHVFGPDHGTVAAALGQLGAAIRDLGDPDGALRCYERAVAILRASSPPNPSDLAIALNNLGNNLIALGEGERAIACLQESQALRERVFGPGRGGSFWSATRLAQARLVAGQADSAEAQIERLVAGPARRSVFDLADALQVQGAAAYANRRLDVAHACFDRAFALFDSTLGLSSTHTLGALAVRAALRLELGRRGEAFADARRAEEASREVLRLAARGLAEHEALDFARVRGSGLDVMMALATDSAGLDATARAAVMDAVIRSRLAVLDELAEERRALRGADPSLAPLVRDLEQAREALARAMVAALREGRSPDSAVAAARARRTSAERALAERSGDFETVLRRTTAGLTEVRSQLAGGSALVSYVRHRASAREVLEARRTAPRRAEKERYSALVLRAGASAPEVVALGPAEVVEAVVDRWVAACATPPPADPRLARAAQRRCDALGRAVSAAVWEPVARRFAGAGRALVVPDGALHAVNFMALPQGRGGYLAERGPLVHRLAAERDLMPPDAGDAAGQGLLALGGADFETAVEAAGPPRAAPAAPASGRAPDGDSPRVRFAALPHTREEATEVARLWEEARARGEADQALTRVGPEASEAAFKRLAPGREVVHVATHGFALGPEAAGPSAEGTRAVGAVVAGSRPRARRATVLLPGLALAGANRSPDPGAEDGFLTAEEITALDLSGVRWAVLSACETGRGDPDAVEAVQGLHRAFRRAGVRTVIMSLWAVDDQATRAWMRRLYHARLAGGEDTAESARSACREVLRERRARGLDTHPFHWAAFVAAGDWR
jgi:CHAT domain-containing protein/tetratricopeptide (TPR) repeat protein